MVYKNDKYYFEKAPLSYFFLSDAKYLIHPNLINIDGFYNCKIEEDEYDLIFPGWSVRNQIYLDDFELDGEMDDDKLEENAQQFRQILKECGYIRLEWF